MQQPWVAVVTLDRFARWVLLALVELARLCKSRIGEERLPGKEMAECPTLKLFILP